MARRCSTLLAVLLLAGCAPWQPADDRGPTKRPERGAEPRAVQAPPSWYSVRRGDTLYSIAFRYGLDWRKVAAWNGIQAPFTIRPGQELRMSAPPARPASTVASEREPPTEPPSRQVSNPSPQPKPDPEPPPSKPAAPRPQAAPEASGQVRTVSDVAWQWPTDGTVSRRFDPSATRKGIGLSGRAGQAVRAAAGGEVVYSGTALIGYGELIIIKHSDKLLSAYGHNRRRLVAEGDRVQRGEKIAEMGLDDRQEELLHFEIRRDGEPVNPLDFLPRR